jgi:hypothetical protein
MKSPTSLHNLIAREKNENFNFRSLTFNSYQFLSFCLVVEPSQRRANKCVQFITDVTVTSGGLIAKPQKTLLQVLNEL